MSYDQWKLASPYENDTFDEDDEQFRKDYASELADLFERARNLHRAYVEATGSDPGEREMLAMGEIEFERQESARKAKVNATVSAVVSSVSEIVNTAMADTKARALATGTLAARKLAEVSAHA